MGIFGKVGSWFKKTGKSIKNTAEDIGEDIVDVAEDIGEDIVDVAEDVVDAVVDSAKCLEAITKAGLDIRGKAFPKKWILACAKRTILKGQGPEKFRACIERKIKKEYKDIKNPKKYANRLWKDIKKNCSC
jgi:hypothetical protein